MIGITLHYSISDHKLKTPSLSICYCARQLILCLYHNLTYLQHRIFRFYWLANIGYFNMPRSIVGEGRMSKQTQATTGQSLGDRWVQGESHPKQYTRGDIKIWAEETQHPSTPLPPNESLGSKAIPKLADRTGVRGSTPLSGGSWPNWPTKDLQLPNGLSSLDIISRWPNHITIETIHDLRSLNYSAKQMYAMLPKDIRDARQHLKAPYRFLTHFIATYDRSQRSVLAPPDIEPDVEPISDLENTNLSMPSSGQSPAPWSYEVRPCW